MTYLDIVFLIGRVIFGGFFVMSGFNHFKNSKILAPYAQAKGVPMAYPSVLFTGLLLLLGGLGVILGVYPRLALVLIIVFLVPTSFMMHNFWKDTDPGQKMTNQINFNKNMALLGAALMMMMLSVPWAYSLIK